MACKKKSRNLFLAGIFFSLVIIVLALIFVVHYQNSLISGDAREGKAEQGNGGSEFSFLSVFVKHKELQAARNTWDQQNISNYRISLRHIQSVWHAQVYELTVSKEEIDHSAVCIPAPVEGGECEIQSYDPEDYTVSGLFEKAAYLLSGTQSPWVQIEYDPRYGFPSSITLDNPELIDEDNAWTVTGFEVLE